VTGRGLKTGARRGCCSNLTDKAPEHQERCSRRFRGQNVRPVLEEESKERSWETAVSDWQVRKIDRRGKREVLKIHTVPVCYSL